MDKLDTPGLKQRLKNSDFIKEIKMAEKCLNQTKNLAQIDQPDAVWKLYFAL